MKKNMLLGLLLLCSFTTFAQSKTSGTATDPKWKVRLRIIDAIPVSSSYVLSGTDIKVSSAVVPELDFTYFFSKNLAAELILGTTKHTVKLGTTAELGKVWLLPPTLNLQYHFAGKTVDPYIGAGINYTIFYGVSDGAAQLHYSNSVGFSTQLGCDFNVSDKWYINVDVKKLFLKTDVKVGTSTTALPGGVKLDPFIIGLGIGTRF